MTHLYYAKLNNFYRSFTKQLRRNEMRTIMIHNDKNNHNIQHKLAKLRIILDSIAWNCLHCCYSSFEMV